MQKLFTLFLALLASVGTISAEIIEHVQIGALYYNLYDEYQLAEVTFKSYHVHDNTLNINEDWNVTSATIPASVEYNSVPYSVISIGDYAFYGCSGLTSVNIPNSVTSVGNDAFYGCSGLTSVMIPNSVTSIENSAFYDCFSLTSVTIGNSVTSIGDYVFRGCSGLTSVVWNAKNCTDFNNSSTPFYYGSHGFSYDYDLSKQITSFAFGDEVEHIPAYLCAQMTNLTSIEIPSSVTSIGNRAFYGCSGLTSIEIPNSVISIGDYAFDGCTDITSVTWNAQNCSAWNFGSQVESFIFGNSVEVIPSWICSGMNKLNSITIPNSVDSIGGGAFCRCSGLTNVTIGNGVTSIGNSAFYDCSGLTSIEIPNSVTSIGINAFCGSGLTSIEIPESVTSIGRGAFAACANLSLLRVTNIDIQVVKNEEDEGWPGSDIFVNSMALKYVSAPASLFDISTYYTSYPSYFPQKLETLEITNGELSENAMWLINLSRKTLKSIDLAGTTHTTLIDEAFNEFYNLQTLVLPANLTHIGYKMVAECVKLKSIDIPASVVEIDDRAFEDCRSIETITFAGVQPSAVSGKRNAPNAASQLKRIGNWAFYNAHELQHLEIPEGVEEIGDGAFYGCTYLQDLVLPSSVKSIGDNCFALCSKLEKIIVNSPEPPTIAAKTFFDVSRAIPVYVPESAVDAYKNDPYWKEMNIQASDEGEEGGEGGEGGEGEESLDQITNDQLQTTNKIIRNGQLFILRGDKVYTVTGQEVR